MSDPGKEQHSRIRWELAAWHRNMPLRCRACLSVTLCSELLQPAVSLRGCSESALCRALQEFSAKPELTGSHGAYQLGLGAAGAQHRPCSRQGGGAGPAGSERERSSPVSAGKTNTSLVRSTPQKAWKSDSFLCCNNAIQKTIGIV